MPRPNNQDQMRFTMLAVNQAFFGAINQSAKTSRGSWSGGNFLILVPSGKTAACGPLRTEFVTATCATAWVVSWATAWAACWVTLWAAWDATALATWLDTLRV